MSKRIFDKKNVYLFLILTGIFFQLFYIQVSAQTLTNKWYVDKNATGLKNGTSWVNGWTSFSAINWSSIQPGDTIFISGGNSSLVYNESLSIGKSGVSGHPIVITKGLSSGHNGQIIIDGQNTRLDAVNMNGCDYITISYLTMQNWADHGIDMDGASNALVSHCTFYHTEGIAVLRIRNSSNVIVEYCTSDQTSTPNAGTFGGNGDFLQATNGSNYVFRYNNITLRNSNVDDHCDIFQIYSMLGNVTVYGNYYAHLDTKTTNAQGIYMTTSNITLTCYNNIAYFPYAKSAIGINNVGGYSGTLIAYGNSFYQGSGAVGNCIWLSTPAPDNIIKNNILYSASSTGVLYISPMSSGNQIDYNILYAPNSSYLVYSGGSKSWSAWQALGYDTHGYNVNPNFVSIGANVSNFLVQTGSQAINNGIDLGAPYNTDILGNIRPTSGAWDIGAYEYKDGSVVTDNTPPALLTATLINPTIIVLTFSEPLELTSAQAKSNYSINNGIIINNAVLSSDGKKVTLNTSTNSANQTYTVVVSNVKDLAGNVVASSGNSASYSFTQTSTGDLKANVKVFLEGPLDSNVMLTELSGNEFLPSAQPYNTAPWFYGGKEVLGSGVSSATDWMLVELHSAQDPSQIVAKRACLLRNDGRIMEPNGTLGVTFNNLFYGSYYIAVRHRNHLAVMSSSPVSFSPNNDLYDFTNSVNKAYGQNAMMQIASGVYAMYAGDGNGDGVIDDKDRDDIWNSQNGNMGYLNGDFNLDSGVTVKDINDFWNINHDKKMQVP